MKGKRCKGKNNRILCEKNGREGAQRTQEAAENLTTFIEQKITTELDTRSQILATKADVADAKAETIKVKAD